MSDELHPQSPTPPGARDGTLEDAVAGRYDFSIEAVVSEAWQRVRGSKQVLLTAAIAIFVGVSVVSWLLRALLIGDSIEDAGLVRRALFQAALCGLAYPFVVGLLMLGIRRAAGTPIEAIGAIGYLDRARPVAIAAVLMAVLTVLGFALFYLPGLYLTVAWLFSLPLIVDKGLGPWEAMEASRRAVTHHWFKVFGTMLVLGLIGIVGAITLVGAVWTIPLWIIGYGVLYRTIFGGGVEAGVVVTPHGAAT